MYIYYIILYIYFYVYIYTIYVSNICVFVGHSFLAPLRHYSILTRNREKNCGDKAVSLKGGS